MPPATGIPSSPKRLSSAVASSSDDGAVQLEGRQRHAGAVVCESTCSALSTPAPMSTGAPRSARPRPKRRQRDDRVERARRGPHVAKPHELLLDLAVAGREHHAVALAHMREQRERVDPVRRAHGRDAIRADLLAARPELDAHRAHAGAAARAARGVERDQRRRSPARAPRRRPPRHRSRRRPRACRGTRCGRRRSTCPSSRAARGRSRAAPPGSRGWRPGLVAHRHQRHPGGPARHFWARRRRCRDPSRRAAACRSRATRRRRRSRAHRCASRSGRSRRRG